MKKIELPFKVKRPILACGADVKSAFALARGGEAFLAGPFGDLEDIDNFNRYEKAVKKYSAKLRIRPEIIACDLHPGYFSARFAENYTLSAKRYTLYKIQHHAAHIASAITDNSINGHVIGVAFDGTGFGSDGNIWGGEFFVGNLKGLRRAAHLEYIPMPGAGAAVSQPWRMAVAYLYNALGKRVAGLKMDFLKKLSGKKLEILIKMMDKNVNSPLTSSAGRLFDAAGSLILPKDKVAREAELPVELERIASQGEEGGYGFDTAEEYGMLVIGFSRTIRGIVKDLSKGVDRAIISARFHNTVADAICRTVLRLSAKFGTKKVVLSGGVFQNRYLTDKAVLMMRQRGLDVYPHHKIKTNDNGIPIGQIAIAMTLRP